MRGRKVIPIDMKKAKGTNRKCREREAPKTTQKRSFAPSWLNKRAKQIFWHISKNRLSDWGFDSATYTEMIAQIAFHKERVERFSKYLEDNGETYIYKKVIGKDAEGNAIISETEKARPQVYFLKEADRRYTSLLTEFGLSPAAVQKVGAKKETKKSNEFDNI